MANVIVLRGISGAGKTTFVEENYERSGVKAISVSADNYMVDEKGKYAFDPRRLDECHAKCLARFVALAQNAVNDSVIGYDVIVVDNTNSTLWEVSPYVHVARAYGHDVRVITFLCDPRVAFERSRHGVSANVLVAMHSRLQESIASMPFAWNQEVRFVCM